MPDQPHASDAAPVHPLQEPGTANKDGSAQDSGVTSETEKQSPTSDLNTLSAPVKELIVAEYTHLTTQITNRQSIRYQMIQFALAALAALLTVSSIGIQNHLDLLIFAYPILVLVLSITYTTNAFEGRRIRAYITDRIETLLPGATGWYGYRQSDKVEALDSMGNMGAKAVFILTAMVAILIGIQIMRHDGISELLLKVAVGATIILTILLLGESVMYDQMRKWHWIERLVRGKTAPVPGEEPGRKSA
jgi:hypothetical protein